jgi:hypothetical protein
MNVRVYFADVVEVPVGHGFLFLPARCTTLPFSRRAKRTMGGDNVVYLDFLGLVEHCMEVETRLEDVEPIVTRVSAQEAVGTEGRDYVPAIGDTLGGSRGGHTHHVVDIFEIVAHAGRRFISRLVRLLGCRKRSVKPAPQRILAGEERDEPWAFSNTTNTPLCIANVCCRRSK